MYSPSSQTKPAFSSSARTASPQKVCFDHLWFRIDLLDVAPLVRPPVLEVEDLSRGVRPEALFQTDDLYILLDSDLARVV